MSGSIESIAGLPPEKEAEIIEKIARRIVNSGFGTIAVMALESMAPLSFAGTQIGLIFASPIMMTLDMLGFKAYEYAGLFAESSRSRENMERLISRIEELMKVEEEARRKEREAIIGRQPTWVARIKHFFGK